ncbi:glycosyltransferase [Agromyces indicus]|uniref:Glycosyltransferase n=1 Tax=Agromyces indicus TaxID=758919 RepID=A0ABU1FPN0_9MICO|nr:glycosyltransferase [Agromyces indicus]MDR5693356.1 glycosyltransferase [Agromyces indicus]
MLREVRRVTAAGPVAEVVIAVHDARRPVGRAIGSIVGEPGAGREHGVSARARVTVVCHNIEASAFAATVERFADADVRWLELHDGIRSPAGPFNHGLARAEAPYVSVMGSDDWFDPGAVDAAVRHLERDAPEVLVLPLRHQDGPPMANPLSRRGRHRRLDPVKDRLAYRTAPLAFIDRRLVDRLELEFVPKLRSGEDAPFSARLWNFAERIDFHPTDPGYVIGADAAVRVTTAPMGVEDELAPYIGLFAEPWVAAMPPSRRHALVVKTLRIHLVGGLVRRAEADSLGPGEHEAYRSLAQAGLSIAPRALDPMSRRDRAILDLLVAERPAELGALREAGRRRNRAGRADRLLTRDLRHALDRESDLRRVLRYVGWPH